MSDELQKEADRLKAEASKFYQEYAALVPKLDKFVRDVNQLGKDLVHMMNTDNALRARVAASEELVAKNEAEARTRLASTEQSHRAIIERLTKKEVELGNKLSDLERREASAAAERQKYETLAAELDRRLRAVERQEKVIADAAKPVAAGRK